MSGLPLQADLRASSPLDRKVPYVWPGRAVQDGLPRSANVRAASMYQASEVEHLLLAIMGIRAHPGLATGQTSKAPSLLVAPGRPFVHLFIPSRRLGGKAV